MDVVAGLGVRGGERNIKDSFSSDYSVASFKHAYGRNQRDGTGIEKHASSFFTILLFFYSTCADDVANLVGQGLRASLLTLYHNPLVPTTFVSL